MSTSPDGAGHPPAPTPPANPAKLRQFRHAFWDLHRHFLCAIDGFYPLGNPVLALYALRSPAPFGDLGYDWYNPNGTDAFGPRQFGGGMVRLEEFICPEKRAEAEAYWAKACPNGFPPSYPDDPETGLPDFSKPIPQDRPPGFIFVDVAPDGGLVVHIPEGDLKDHFIALAGEAWQAVGVEWADNAVRRWVRRVVRERIEREEAQWLRQRPDPNRALDALVDHELPGVLALYSAWELWLLLLPAELWDEKWEGREFVKKLPRGESKWPGDPAAVIEWICSASVAVLDRRLSEALEGRPDDAPPSGPPPPGPERDRWIAERWHQCRYRSKEDFAREHGLSEKVVKDALERERKRNKGRPKRHDAG